MLNNNHPQSPSIGALAHSAHRTSTGSAGNPGELNANNNNNQYEFSLVMQPRFAWGVHMSLAKPICFVGTDTLVYPCGHHLAVYNVSNEDVSYTTGPLGRHLEERMRFLTRNYPKKSKRIEEEDLKEMAGKDWSNPKTVARMNARLKAAVENHSSLEITSIISCPGQIGQVHTP